MTTMTKNLSTALACKVAIQRRLQQGPPKDALHIDAQYHDSVAELFPLMSSCMRSLSEHTSAIDWAASSKAAFIVGELPSWWYHRHNMLVEHGSRGDNCAARTGAGSDGRPHAGQKGLGKSFAVTGLNARKITTSIHLNKDCFGRYTAETASCLTHFFGGTGGGVFFFEGGGIGALGRRSVVEVRGETVFEWSRLLGGATGVSTWPVRSASSMCLTMSRTLLGDASMDVKRSENGESARSLLGVLDLEGSYSVAPRFNESLQDVYGENGLRLLPGAAEFLAVRSADIKGFLARDTDTRRAYDISLAVKGLVPMGVTGVVGTCGAG